VPSEPLNTLPIQQFIKTVEQLDKANQKEVKLTMTTARTLSNTLGIVMSRLAGNYEDLLRKSSSTTSTEDITVELDGGSGWGKS